MVTMLMLKPSHWIAAWAVVTFILRVNIADAQEVRRQQRRLPDGTVPINLYELLGPDSYAKGVMWQPMQCYAPLSQRMDGPSEEKLKRLDAMMLQEMMQALSEVANVSMASLNGDSSFPLVSGLVPALDQKRMETDHVHRKAVLRSVYRDARYWRWVRRLSEVVLRYTALNRDPATESVPVACPSDETKALLGRTTPLKQVDCRKPSTVIEHLGFFNDPYIRLSVIVERVIRDPGWCSVRPVYEPYGHWLKKERIMRRRHGEQRFRFDNRHKDRVVFLFDLLYESEHAFKRQHWLGAVVQQNPFDMYAIMDLIHTLAPDLIVETGTANGGSALMWASMLELTHGPGAGARVITIDVVEPVTDSWAGKSTKDPTKNPLWGKYVTFLKGSSLDEQILATVRQAAAAAKVVLVLLDSDHTEHHVQLECEAYCPLVTPGSYCIVEDTKLSRFSAVGGPAPGVRRFLDKHATEFIADRDREPFYTQHVGGYLQRLNTTTTGTAAATTTTTGAGTAAAAAAGGRRRLRV